MYLDLKVKLSEVINNARRISLFCDVWSKQGMTASFLGVTIHCFSPVDRKRHNITLSVKRFEQPHTGDRLANLLLTIIDEWGIPHHKVFRSLTDNGSNVVKAFKVLQQREIEQEVDEPHSENDQENDKAHQDLSTNNRQDIDDSDDDDDDCSFIEASARCS